MVAGNHLRKADPGRYGGLHHPGDRFAYDMFSQLGRLVREPGTGLLGPLTAEVVLAVGESQSATFLITYVNAVDPLAAVYDGFLVHGRGASGAPLAGGFMLADDPELATRAAALQEGRQRIREDVRVPVLTVQSETDVVALGGGRARQAEGERFRLWEIAGAAHFDTYGLSAAFVDDGSLSGDRLVELLAPASNHDGVHGR